MKLTHRVIEVASPKPYTLHPARMHRPIVEAVLAGDSETAFSTMKKHAIEFGEILIETEETYRKKKYNVWDISNREMSMALSRRLL